MQTASTKTTFQIAKFAKIDVPLEHQENGIVAVQLIEVTCNFFGKTIKEIMDTKILADGRQIVVDGNGYLKAGTEIQ